MEADGRGMPADAPAHRQPQRWGAEEGGAQAGAEGRAASLGPRQALRRPPRGPAEPAAGGKTKFSSSPTEDEGPYNQESLEYSRLCSLKGRGMTEHGCVIISEELVPVTSMC